MESMLRHVNSYINRLGESVPRKVIKLEDIKIFTTGYKENNDFPEISAMKPYEWGSPWGGGIDSHAWFYIPVDVPEDMRGDDTLELCLHTDRTGWDADNNAVDYAGSFADVEITKDGEYTVSLTTGDMGFGDTQAFNLLFVSTDIPNKLMKGGYLTISDVKTKIGSGATQEGANVNIEEGDYARIDVINTYAAETAFGYNVPGANETITITFTVSGMAD